MDGSVIETPFFFLSIESYSRPTGDPLNTGLCTSYPLNYALSPNYGIGRINVRNHSAIILKVPAKASQDSVRDKDFKEMVGAPPPFDTFAVFDINLQLCPCFNASIIRSYLFSFYRLLMHSVPDFQCN